MLTLRRDWSSITGGAAAANLVAQIDTVKLRDEIACHLIGAALDLLVSTWPRRDRAPLALEEVRKSVWRISGIHYIYLPNDDATLGICIKLARSAAVTAILPHHYERLKRQLLTRTLRHRSPNIWSFDTFISWRTTSATIDQQWPPEEAVLELLTAYNRRIINSGGNSALLVQIPE